MKKMKFQSQVLMASFLLLALLSFNLPVDAKTALSPNSLEAKRGRERSIIVKPDVNFQIDIWANQPDYYVGEDIRIFFHSNRDCYVYIFDIDTNGSSRQIFPNYFDRDNHIKAGQTYSIPDYGYRLEVTGPQGREYLRVVGVSERFPFLRDFERFDRSDPFPRHPHGFEGFKNQLESKLAEKEYHPDYKQERFDDYPSRKTDETQHRRDFPDSKPGRQKGLEISPRPVRPVPPYRDYAESYTSFYVRARWYEGDDYFRRSVREKKILFSSIPDDAELYIDGRPIGKTSQKVYLSYGNHLIRLRKRGYSDWVRYLFVHDKSPSHVIGDLRKHTNEQYYPYRPEWDRNYREDWGKPGTKEPLGEDDVNIQGHTERQLKGTEMTAPKPEDE
ncbi:DUF4384 domain-containing protein [Candidatus Sumerlaeota bacterium]|nr:DUF4384 domain-containing protein [Candidatus Sumerlaeota bacterium]